MVAVTLEDVSLRYSRQWTLVRISAQFPEGKSTLITGDNGAGKTTLLRIVGTAIRPTFGRVHIFGVDAFQNRESIRTELGIISHNSHLYYDLSALENLELVSRFSGLKVTQAEYLQVLEKVGLGECKDQMVRKFSAGMKRRVMIARLLMRAPRLVILDEPFGQLDPAGVALMRSVIEDLQERGATILLATHLHELGRSICDFEMSLDNGEISKMLQPVSELRGA